MDISIISLAGFFDGQKYHKGPLSISISKGKIKEIINGVETIDAKTVIDGRGKIASMPFHDAHTHLIFAGDRFFELGLKLDGMSYSSILDQGGGIKYTMNETKNVSDVKLKDLLIDRLDTMLENGTLYAEVKSGYGLSIEEEIRHLRIIQDVNKTHQVHVFSTFGGAHVPPPNYPRDQYVSDIIETMLPIIAKDNLASSTDVFCDKGAFNIDETRSIFEKSLELNIPIRVHAEELEYTGIGKIAANEYQALSVDHLLHAKIDDFQVYEKCNTVANFMPLAPIGLFSNISPEGWNKTECIIGLGSDFNPNNWIISMQTAIRMGVFRYRMTPEIAFKAATTGAHQSITGKVKKSIDVNDTADLILLKGNTLSELCAKIGQNLVTHIIKNGQLIKENTHRMT